jgi:hypothetical protein
MRLAIAPDGLAPDELAPDVDVDVDVDVSELGVFNKPGRNLYAPNPIKPRAIIKKMGGGLFLWLVF